MFFGICIRSGIARVAIIVICATCDCAEASDFFWKAERERVDEAIQAGRYEDALRCAEDFKEEYRRAWSAASQLERNGSKGRYQFYKAVVDFAIADAQRYCGQYDAAKAGYTSAGKVFDDLTRKTFAQYCLQMQFKGTFEQCFLRAWDQGTIQGLYNASQGLEAASSGVDETLRTMLTLVGLRALLLDCYGSMEMDGGNLDAAERLFNRGLEVRESIGGERLDRIVEPHNRVYGTVSRNFGRLCLKRGEELYRAAKAADSRSKFDRADHYFTKAEEFFDGVAVGQSGTQSLSGNAEPHEQLDQQVKWMTLRSADLNFNRAEWAMAMAVYDAEHADGKQAAEYLDQADRLLSEASDAVEQSIDSGDHPYLIYCWASLAGVAARRAVLLDEPLDEESLVYLDRAEELMRKRNMPSNAPQAGVIENERAWVNRARRSTPVEADQ